MAAAAPRPVVVAGSVGPTGELIEPIGSMTEAAAIAAFTEEMEGLKAGGADVAWIETKSAAQEMRAAARAAIEVGLPYTVTASFDTAGRTMMGLRPPELVDVFAELPVAPVAIGANCGVGASDLLLAIQQMRRDGLTIIAKSNCGIPRFRGDGDRVLRQPGADGPVRHARDRFGRSDRRRLLRHVAGAPRGDAAQDRRARGRGHPGHSTPSSMPSVRSPTRWRPMRPTTSHPLVAVGAAAETWPRTARLSPPVGCCRTVVA